MSHGKHEGYSEWRMGSVLGAYRISPCLSIVQTGPGEDPVEQRHHVIENG